MNKFTTILVPIVFFGCFIAVHISGPISKDGKGDNTSAAIDEPRDLQAIKHAHKSTNARVTPDSVSRNESGTPYGVERGIAWRKLGASTL